MADTSKNPINRATIRIETPIEIREVASELLSTSEPPTDVSEEPLLESTPRSLLIKENENDILFQFPDCTTRSALDQVLTQLDTFFHEHTITHSCIFSFAHVPKMSVSIIGSLHEHTKEIRKNGIDVIFEIPQKVLERQSGLEELLLKHFQLRKL